ncbi:MAG TPA: creatininase family protein [Gaiellaceae bacterium]|jgi:creatinine amidohydrolase|nr:creatininase family protein [Gaiellaceae bacterium]
MRAYDCNWLQIEDYLEHDDRVVLPTGSTEQHAYLSLGTDNILAERVALEAAEPLGVPVLPCLPYGITPAFAAYPGSPSLRTDTFLAVLADLLDSLYDQGFHRILVVNGHGGNTPAQMLVKEWMGENPDGQAIFHDWFGEAVIEVIRSIAPGEHASWWENFPWTRLPAVELPAEEKPRMDEAAYVVADPAGVRELLGDGSFGGEYERPQEDLDRVWQAAVRETRGLLESGWRSAG